MENQAPFIHIKHLDESTYCLETEGESYGKPWFHDIKKYLEKQVYPDNASIIDKKALRKLSSKFFLSGDVLYKRSYDSVLLRCVYRYEADQIITDMHEGSFRTYSSGHSMSRKILRARYY